MLDYEQTELLLDSGSRAQGSQSWCQIPGGEGVFHVTVGYGVRGVLKLVFAC